MRQRVQDLVGSSLIHLAAVLFILAANRRPVVRVAGRPLGHKQLRPHEALVWLGQWVFCLGMSIAKGRLVRMTVLVCQESERESGEPLLDVEILQHPDRGFMPSDRSMAIDELVDHVRGTWTA